MSQRPKRLIKKIEALPADRVAEVEDFVDFIAAREAHRNTTQDALAASEAAFAGIWNNPDDDVYDAL